MKMFMRKIKGFNERYKSIILVGVACLAAMGWAVVPAAASPTVVYQWDEGGAGFGSNSPWVSHHIAGGPVLVDDFVPVLGGQVAQVDWWGSAATSSGWELVLHDDASGIPAVGPDAGGIRKYQLTATGSDADGDGVFHYSVSLPQDVTLLAGTRYWFCAANYDDGWYWANAGGAGPSIGSQSYFAERSTGMGPDGGPHYGPWNTLADQNLAFSVSVVPEHALALVNAGFETGDLTGWTPMVTEGGSISVVSSHTRLYTSQVIVPAEGNSFALLKTDGPGSEQQLKQSFVGTAGDVLSFSYFFDGEDYMPYNDYATGILRNLDTLDEVQLFYQSISGVGDYGFTPWTNVDYTLTASGNYEIRFVICNSGDSVVDSYLGVDMVPEPATLSLLVLGGLAMLVRRKTA